MPQKLSKNMLIVKFYPGMKCLHVFFLFFIPGWNFIPAFLIGMSSSRDEISYLQKRVNSKKYFTIDRDIFILGWVSSRDDITQVNTLSVIYFMVLPFQETSRSECTAHQDFI